MKRFMALLLVFICATAQSMSVNAGSIYKAFSITSPTNDQGVRANDGNVTVQLSLQPALQSGHLIVLDINGEDGQSSETTSSLTITLSNMSRGLHNVMATVVDKDGNALIKTAPVSFHVLRVGE